MKTLTPLQWARLRKKAYLLLPAVQTLAVYYGVTTEHEAGLWVAFFAMLLSNTGFAVARSNVNVSRETSRDLVTAMGTGKIAPNVSRETITAPCVVMHGTAEPHVLGCDGWSFDRG
jgi:hypothetical protein